jgi:hypothetical protein
MDSVWIGFGQILCLISVGFVFNFIAKKMKCNENHVFLWGMCIISMFEFCFPVWGLAGSDCGLWGRLRDRLWDRLRTLGGLWGRLWDGLWTLGGLWAQSSPKVCSPSQSLPQSPQSVVWTLGRIADFGRILGAVRECPAKTAGIPGKTAGIPAKTAGIPAKTAGKSANPRHFARNLGP